MARPIIAISWMLKFSITYAMYLGNRVEQSPKSLKAYFDPYCQPFQSSDIHYSISDLQSVECKLRTSATIYVQASRRTDRRLDQIPLLIPPCLFIPLLTPFLRCTMIVLMFLICPRLLIIVLIGLPLSGWRKTVATSSLSLITAISKVGRRKYDRRRDLPCGVLAL